MPGVMKKTTKRLKVGRETIRALEGKTLEKVVGGTFQSDACRNCSAADSGCSKTTGM
jgi:hypothetical protein